jgi:hypothetical protein
MKWTILLALLTCSVLATAQTQLYVSPSGSGTVCTIGSPCASINQAVATYSNGTAAVINVAPGNYPAVTTTISKGGSSQSTRLVIQCTTFQQCFMGNGSRLFFAANTSVNNIDIGGLDFGPCASCDSAIETSSGGAAAGMYNSIHIIGNNLHDYAQNVAETNPPITGCPVNGMITMGVPHGVNFSVVDIQIIGNKLTNYGRLNVGCNRTW